MTKPSRESEWGVNIAERESWDGLCGLSTMVETPRIL